MGMGSFRFKVMEFMWENICLKMNVDFDWGKNREVNINLYIEVCFSW